MLQADGILFAVPIFEKGAPGIFHGYAAGWTISHFLPAMLEVLNRECPYLNIEVECHP